MSTTECATADAPTTTGIVTAERPAKADRGPDRSAGRNRASTIIVTAILVVVAIYFLIPVYWVVVAATKTTGDLFATYGFWFAPEREMLQALIDKSQEHVEGEVTLKLYKGNSIVIGRTSPKSLYSDKMVTFEDDAGAYDQRDAEGFIKLNALRLRLLARRDAE